MKPLRDTSYVPILLSRVAEVKAFGNLSTLSKVRCIPIFVWRPWPNANDLSKTAERVIEAVGNLPFALDLDINKFDTSIASTACVDFCQLFDGLNGFQNYYTFVSKIENAIPVLRPGNGDYPDLSIQLLHAKEIGRGSFIRLQQGLSKSPNKIIDRVYEQDHSDLTFVVDAGWSRDILQREMWASDIVGHIAAKEPEREIVLASSSFPESFSNVGAEREFDIRERQLFSSIQRRHNSATLVYGDWGSTRPPPLDKTPMTNVPRIDLANLTRWTSFRKIDADVGYPSIARRAVSHANWNGTLDVWGAYCILATVDSLPGAIRSPAAAAAARVNMHLHYQANFDNADGVGDTPEPYED